MNESTTVSLAIINHFQSLFSNFLLRFTLYILLGNALSPVIYNWLSEILIFHPIHLIISKWAHHSFFDQFKNILYVPTLYFYPRQVFEVKILYLGHIFNLATLLLHFSIFLSQKFSFHISISHFSYMSPPQFPYQFQLFITILDRSTKWSYSTLYFAWQRSYSTYFYYTRNAHFICHSSHLSELNPPQFPYQFKIIHILYFPTLC